MEKFPAKLYSLPLSAFAARCRIQIYEKGLPVEVLAPPGGLSGAAFAAVSPTRRIPALELADGRVLVESDVICEFLEDCFPEPPLRPADLVELAKMRTLIRATDNYLSPQVGLLLRLDDNNDEAHGSTRRVAELISSFQAGTDLLVRLMSEEGYVISNDLTLADTAIAPMLFLAHVTLAEVGIDAFEGQPRLREYMGAASQVPSVRRALIEQSKDLPQRFASTGDAFFSRY